MLEGTGRRPLWLEEGTGQVVQGLVGHGEDLDFDPEDSGSHGDLWAEEGQALTQALKDALWWPLPGGQLVGAGGPR